MSQHMLTCFQNLPRELRDEIWELAATRNPNVRGVHYFSVHSLSQVPIKISSSSLRSPPSAHGNVLYLPPLLDPEHLPSSPPSWVADNASTYAWPQRLASVCKESLAAVKRHHEHLLERAQDAKTEGRGESDDDPARALLALTPLPNPAYCGFDMFCPDRDFVFLQLSSKTFTDTMLFTPSMTHSSTGRLQTPKNIAIELPPDWLQGIVPNRESLVRECLTETLIYNLGCWHWSGARTWLVDRRPGNRQKFLDALGREDVPFPREQMGFEDIHDAAGCRYMTIPGNDYLMSRPSRANIDWESIRKLVAGLKQELNCEAIVGPSMGLLVCD